MYRSLKTFSLVIALSSLTGCIALINGLTQEVSISSTPSGALVEISGEKCITPCSIRIKRRSEETTLHLTPEGSPTYSESIVPVDYGPWWYQGVALLEGYAIIPALIDLSLSDLSYNWPRNIHVYYNEAGKPVSLDIARADLKYRSR